MKRKDAIKVAKILGAKSIIKVEASGGYFGALQLAANIKAAQKFNKVTEDLIKETNNCLEKNPTKKR
jgi:hypothetical protein